MKLSRKESKALIKLMRSTPLIRLGRQGKLDSDDVMTIIELDKRINKIKEYRRWAEKYSEHWR